MLSIEEANGDLARYARAWLRERMAVTRSLVVEARRRPVARTVHDLRTSCRRLREALRMFEGVPGNPALPKLDRQARRIMKALGPLREADVALHVLEELAADSLDASTESGRRRLARRIEKERRGEGKRAHEALRRRGKKLRRALVRRADWPRVAPLSVRADDEAAQASARTRAFLAARLAERRSAVAERIAALPDIVGGGADAASRLHAVRIAIKQWRYAAEIARPTLDGAEARELVASLRRLLELGGRTQDLSDLTRRIETRVKKARRRRRRELRGLAAVVAAKRDGAAAAFVAALRALPLGSALAQPPAGGAGESGDVGGGAGGTTVASLPDRHAGKRRARTSAALTAAARPAIEIPV